MSDEQKEQHIIDMFTCSESDFTHIHDLCPCMYNLNNMHEMVTKLFFFNVKVALNVPTEQNKGSTSQGILMEESQQDQESSEVATR